MQKSAEKLRLTHRGFPQRPIVPLISAPASRRYRVISRLPSRACFVRLKFSSSGFAKKLSKYWYTSISLVDHWAQLSALPALSWRSIFPNCWPAISVLSGVAREGGYVARRASFISPRIATPISESRSPFSSYSGKFSWNNFIISAFPAHAASRMGEEKRWLSHVGRWPSWSNLLARGIRFRYAAAHRRSSPGLNGSFSILVFVEGFIASCNAGQQSVSIVVTRLALALLSSHTRSETW
jgi:hypothetical protein